jgi:hypothetical protein
MSDYVGGILTYDIYVVDTTTAPMLGESPVLHEGHGPSGDHGFHISEVSGGYYRITSNPTFEAGDYAVVAWFREPGDVNHQKISVTWDVDPLPADQDFTILLDAEHGTTLSELRRRVARAVRDYRQVITTAQGSTTTVVDIFNLVNNTDYYRGAELICTVGHPENIGKKRKVVSSSFEGGVVTFTPPLPHGTQLGDQFDIFRFARLPFGISEYDQAINDAIAAAYPANREKVMVVLNAPFLSDTGYLEIPSTIYGIYGISAAAGMTSWVDYDAIPPAASAYNSGFWIDSARRRITFGPLGDYMNEKTVAIYGYAHPAPLLRDSDKTTTDPEWIVDQAVSSLLQSNLDQTTFAVGQARANRADQLRGKMVKPPEPNTIWLG